MFAEFLFIGGVLFWCAFVVVSLVIISAIEGNKGEPKKALAIGSLLTFVLALGLFGNLWNYVMEDWRWLLIVLGGYVGLGIIWSLPKCYFMLKEVRNKLSEMKDDFRDDHKIKPDAPIPADKIGDWVKRINNSDPHYSYGVGYDVDAKKIIAPRFNKYRGRLIVWACLWPWSFIWTIVRHPVLWVIEIAVDWMKGLYQRMSDSMFSGFNDDEE